MFSKPKVNEPDQATRNIEEFQKELTEKLDQLFDAAKGLDPAILSDLDHQYQLIASLLDGLRKLQEENVVEHDKILESKPRYKNMFLKFPNWSKEPLQKFQAQKQGPIITSAIFKCARILAATSKESKESTNAQRILTKLLASQAALHFEGTYLFEEITILAEYLKQNTSLKELSFENAVMNRDCTIAILRAVQSHPTIEKLNMQADDNFPGGLYKPVLEFIKENRSVKKLYFSPLAITTKMAKLLEDELENNHTLTVLEIAGELSRKRHLKNVDLLLARNQQNQQNKASPEVQTQRTCEISIDDLVSLGYNQDKMRNIFTKLDVDPAVPQRQSPRVHK